MMMGTYILIAITGLVLLPVFMRLVHLYGAPENVSNAGQTQLQEPGIRLTWRGRIYFVALTSAFGAACWSLHGHSADGVWLTAFILVLSTLCAVSIKTNCTPTSLTWLLMLLGISQGIRTLEPAEVFWGALIVACVAWLLMNGPGLVKHRVMPPLQNDVVVMAACGACFGSPQAGAMILSIFPGFVAAAFITAMTMKGAQSKQMVSGPLLWTVGAIQVFNVVPSLN